MQPPDELMTGTFLPAMRHLVAIQLRSRGLSQNKISSLIGVTQASVSLYLSSDPGKSYGPLSRFSISKGQADRDSAFLADALQKGPVEGLKALSGIWTGLLGAGAVCPAHREMYPTLADCEFCIEEYGSRGGEVSDAITEVAEAVRLLEQSPDFVAVMPEVSVNIACAAGDATTPGDVIAIPGRIVRVRNHAKAMLPPEPGSSAHMSRMLLLARGKRHELRACINLRYDRVMAAVLSRSNLRTLKIGRHAGEGAADPTAEALERRLKSSAAPFDAIVDEGGSGIEPNVYLFGKGASEVVRMAIRVARAYSAA
jgi:XRE family transcriptional regulator, thiamine biosynthesis regulator